MKWHNLLAMKHSSFFFFLRDLIETSQSKEKNARIINVNIDKLFALSVQWHMRSLNEVVIIAAISYHKEVNHFELNQVVNFLALDAISK